MINEKYSGTIKVAETISDLQTTISHGDLSFSEPQDTEHGWYIVKTDDTTTEVKITGGAPNTTLIATRQEDSVHKYGQITFTFDENGSFIWGASCGGGGHVNNHATGNDVYDVVYNDKHYQVVFHFTD